MYQGKIVASIWNALHVSDSIHSGVKNLNSEPYFQLLIKEAVLDILWLNDGLEENEKDCSLDLSKLPERIKIILYSTNIEEILSLLSDDEYLKLEKFFIEWFEVIFFNILGNINTWEKSIEFYKRALAAHKWTDNPEDIDNQELIEYLEQIVKRTDRVRRWKIYKILWILNARNKNYWDAIDALNRAIEKAPEIELERILIYLWIYFERMWYVDALKILESAKNWNSNEEKRKRIQRILKVCEKRLEKEKAE